MERSSQPSSRFDIIHCLVKDISALPIITSQRQELWLGIQIKAANWEGHLREHSGLGPGRKLQTSVQWLLAAYMALFGYLLELEACCEKVEIQMPKVETWAAELLRVRQNVFELRRSRLRRFVRTLAQIAKEPVKQHIVDLSYNIAELLCFLPDDALNYLIDFAQTSERLPSAGDMEEWAKMSSEFEHPSQMVQRRAKIARDALVTGFARYALRFARNHVDQGLDYPDLAQEGFIGLIKAAERFDYRAQVRFGTYATSWIWQSIGRAIADQCRTIRLPVHLQEKIRKVEKAYERLTENEGGHPAIIDLLLYTDLLPSDDLRAIERFRKGEANLPRQIAKRYQRAVETIQGLIEYAQPTIPLDLTVPDEISSNTQVFTHSYPPEEITLVSLIPDPDSLAPSIVVDQAIAKEVVEQVLDEVLKPRQREIIALRFGLEDGTDRTLEEIGEQFGVTRERIRQIEAKALEKLRHPAHKYALKRAVSKARSQIEAQMVRLHPEILNYLNNEFDYWKRLQIGNKGKNWKWLDRLLERLPGGDRHRARLRDGITRRDQLVGALRALSAPAHYSDIAEQLNEALEAEDLDEGYVYTLLMKHEESFILLGQAVFSLVEWERGRANEPRPVLPFCPSPLPDPPSQDGAFFESVLAASDVLKGRPSVSQFLQDMLKWAEAPVMLQKWYLQSILSAYYLVGLIPYVFHFGGDNPRLECTLPQLDIHGLRQYCLKKLTERLIAMPEFWWAFQRYQPIRPSALGERFIDIHPLDLDDTSNRLNILTSLGASQKLPYGRYRLTPLGEQLADYWKRRPTLSNGAEEAQDQSISFEDDLELIDLAIW
jgi:RNA polymerase sigma factor (sigma-70 family)